MNIKNISVGLVLAAAVGVAFAGTPYPVEGTFAPVNNNVHVVTETQAGFDSSGDAYPVDVVSKSTLTRQQVQAEYIAANRQPLKNPSYAELVFLR